MASTLSQRHTIDKKTATSKVSVGFLTENGKALQDNSGKQIETAFESKLGPIKTQGYTTQVSLTFGGSPMQVGIIEIGGKQKLVIAKDLLTTAPEKLETDNAFPDSILFDLENSTVTFDGENINVVDPAFSCTVTPFSVKLTQDDKTHVSAIRQDEYKIPVAFNRSVSTECLQRANDSSKDALFAISDKGVPRYMFEQYSQVSKRQSFKKQQSIIVTKMIDSKNKAAKPTFEFISFFGAPIKIDPTQDISQFYYNLCKNNQDCSVSFYNGTNSQKIESYKLIHKKDSYDDYYLEFHYTGSNGEAETSLLPLGGAHVSAAEFIKKFESFANLPNETEVDPNNMFPMSAKKTDMKKPANYRACEVREQIDELKIIDNASDNKVEAVAPEGTDLIKIKQSAIYKRFANAAEEKAFNELTTKKRDVNKPAMQLLTTGGVALSLLSIGLVTLLGPIGFGIMFAMGLAMAGMGATIITKADAIKQQTFKITIATPEEDTLRELVYNYNEYQKSSEKLLEFKRNHMTEIENNAYVTKLKKQFGDNFLNDENSAKRTEIVSSLEKLSPKEFYLEHVCNNFFDEDNIPEPIKALFDDKSKAAALEILGKYNLVQNDNERNKKATGVRIQAATDDKLFEIIHPKGKIQNVDIKTFVDSNVDALAERFANKDIEKDLLFKNMNQLIDDESKALLAKKLKEKKDKIKAREAEEAASATENEKRRSNSKKKKTETSSQTSAETFSEEPEQNS